jgi:hypothetical protein
MSLWPIAGFAQTQRLPQVSPDIRGVEQVRQAFNAAGYEVGQADTWNWTSPPVSTFQVIDPSRDRVLLVLVYSSRTAAQGARMEAETHEQALNAGTSTTDNSTPHLVLGYGPSTWVGNVALVQTSAAHLAQMYQSQNDLDDGMYVSPNTVQSAGEALAEVDADFQQALRSSVVNL